jgi:hypothetical protein
MKFWWEKNRDDVNWLPTLKKHSQFEICGIWNSWKLKIYWIEFKIWKVFYHMSTSKEKLYFYDTRKQKKNIFMHFEIRIFFKTKT